MKTKCLDQISPWLIMGLVLFITYGCTKEEAAEEKITDADGNIYTSVTIGTQTWMVENLKTTKYNDGTAIPNVTDNTGWGALLTGAYCWYQNDISNKNPYGALYNAFVGATGKLCPSGWHVPSVDEWNTLTTYLGGQLVAGGKLKEAGTAHWITPNTGATNESGFTALPGGSRQFYNGTYSGIGVIGIYWSATETPVQNNHFNAIPMSNENTTANPGQYVKSTGSSVRCIKD